MKFRDKVSNVPQKNVRGKKTRNPGFKPGNYWVECDRCGSAIRVDDSMKTWDNLIVCPDDYEPRHEQDFVRAKLEDQSPKKAVRTDTEPTFVDTSSMSEPTTSVPEGTFNTNTL